MKSFNKFLEDLVYILTESSPTENEPSGEKPLKNPFTKTPVSPEQLTKLAQRIHGAHYAVNVGSEKVDNKIEPKTWEELNKKSREGYRNLARHAINSITATGLGKELNNPHLFERTMDHYLNLVKVDPNAISDESVVTHHRHAMVAVLQELQQ
jgi:hypothetical protein